MRIKICQPDPTPVLTTYILKWLATSYITKAIANNQMHNNAQSKVQRH